MAVLTSSFRWAAVGMLWVAVCGCSRVESDKVTDKKEQVYRSGRYDEWGFKRIPPPQPGDWLYVVPEEGQTFEEYKAQVGGRKLSQQAAIYLQPTGDLGKEVQALLEPMREYAAIFFDRPAKLLSPTPLPKAAYVSTRQQYEAAEVLVELERLKPADTLALVGITEADLFTRGLNFVFGMGNPATGCGIYSVVRYKAGQSGENTLQRRALKVLNHEVGHILQLKHCVFYRCTMNGSNSLPEADRRPIFLCPVCLEKLQWRLGFDARERYQRLAKFYRRLGFEKDAAFAESLAKRPRG